MSNWTGFFLSNPSECISTDFELDSSPLPFQLKWMSNDKRLASTDKPITSSCGNTILLIIGNVYNHLQLRNDLRYQSWNGDSQHETLVEGFSQKGLSLVADLRGSFVFATYDYRYGQLLLGRDPTGIHSLYVRWLPNGFLFSTNYSHLLTSSDVSHQSISHYLAFGVPEFSNPFPRSSSKGLACFPPGSVCRINHSRSEDAFRYWPPQPRPGWSHLPIATFKHASSFLRSQLEDVVSQQLSTNPNPICLLTSDIASHCIASLVSQLSSTGSMNLSISLPNELCSDSWSHNNRDVCLPSHERLFVDENSSLSIIVNGLNSPDFLSLANPYKFIRFRVLDSFDSASFFSSLGSDALFPPISHSLHILFRILGFLPWIAREALFSSLSGFKSFSSNHHNSIYPDYRNLTCDGAVLKSFVDGSLLPEPISASIDFRALPNLHSCLSWSTIFNFIEPFSLRPFPPNTYSSNHRIHRPFLDKKIVELALRIPLRFHRTNQGLLSAAFRDLQISCYPDRPTTFIPSSHFARWMLGPLRLTCLERLESLALTGLIEKTWIKSKWNALQTDHQSSTYLWRLVLLGELASRLS